MVQILRRESETPIVSAKDDAVLARYAYGGETGIIQGIGEELSVTVDPSNPLHVTVGAGRVVIDGWEVDISSPTDLFFEDRSGSLLYDYIILRIDLLNQTVALSTLTSLMSYGFDNEDLTENPTGSATINIWSRTRTDGVPNSGEHGIPKIPYSKDTLAEIEHRLEVLGFKEGEFTLDSVSSPEGTTVKFQDAFVDVYGPANSIKKQGKYVLISIVCDIKVESGVNYNSYSVRFTFPKEFAPKKDLIVFGYNGATSGVMLYVSPDGRLGVNLPGGGSTTMIILPNVGWEVP